MSGSQFTSSISCTFHGWLLLTPWHAFHPWVLGHHKLLVSSQHTNISFLTLLCRLCLFSFISKCRNAIELSSRILSSLIPALTSLDIHPVPRDCISSPAISNPRLTCLTAYWTLCECLINSENLMGQNWTFGLDIPISTSSISCLAVTQVKVIVSSSLSITSPRRLVTQLSKHSELEHHSPLKCCLLGASHCMLLLGSLQ